MLGAWVLGLVIMGVLTLAAVEWPVLVFSSVRLHPLLLSVTDVFGGVLQSVVSTHPFHFPHLWARDAWRMPSLSAWIGIDVIALVAVVLMGASVAVRGELWRGRPRFGLRPWDPRRGLARRAWGRLRGLTHLQAGVAGSGPVAGARSVKNRAVRSLAGERRRAAPVGGDSWANGSLHGTELRSGPEQHAIVVAPTGAGKTRRVVCRAVAEHGGPVVAVSNKLDVHRATVSERERLGRVRIFAPGLIDPDSPAAVRWSPLAGCEVWDYALEMGGWIYSANPELGKDSSPGAEFFDREATEVVLPPLLHAAALDRRSMHEVYRWVIGDGVTSLDEAAEILIAHGAIDALDQLRGVQQQPDRQRSFSITSARRLIGGYQHEWVNAFDADEFDIDAFINGSDTLYVCALEGKSRVLAPIFGGLLGAILRACEQRAAHVEDPRGLVLLRIVADEAAHLTPLRDLATYLAVSRGWGARWMVVFQSIAQLHQRYGRDADAILANTLTKQFFGPVHDRSTREELIALLGEERVTETTRSTHGFGHSTSKASVTATGPRPARSISPPLGTATRSSFTTTICRSSPTSRSMTSCATRREAVARDDRGKHPGRHRRRLRRLPRRKDRRPGTGRLLPRS